MSDFNQIQTVLERLFNEEGQRIVFWNDPDPIAWGLFPVSCLLPQRGAM
jgi:hypothetical protein